MVTSSPSEPALISSGVTPPNQSSHTLSRLPVLVDSCQTSRHRARQLLRRLAQGQWHLANEVFP